MFASVEITFVSSIYTAFARVSCFFCRWLINTIFTSFNPTTLFSQYDKAVLSFNPLRIRNLFLSIHQSLSPLAGKTGVIFGVFQANRRALKRDFLALLPSHATRASSSPSFRLCSPEIRKELRLFCRQVSAVSAVSAMIYQPTWNQRDL